MNTLSKIFPQLDPPAKIYGQADSTDVNDCMDYLDKFKRHFAAEIVRAITALNENLNCRTIDAGDFCNGLDDLFGDTIKGPLMRIAERLDEGEHEIAGG